MPESKKKKKTCLYKRRFPLYECDRPLYDKEHCIFHSQDREGKKEVFREAFWEEYKAQKKNDESIFTGFLFPDKFDLRKADLQGAYLQEADLKGANLIKADLQRTYLTKADLQGANLQEADLREAHLIKAYLQGAKLWRAKLWRAKLKGAYLWRAKLKGTKIQRADLRGADLMEANLREAKLQGAKLQGADFQGANIKRANLDNSTFKETKVNGVKFNSLTRCQGIDVTQAIGSPLFDRFVKDQEYLDDFYLSHRLIYHIWNVFADCGRSLWRWIAWSLFIALYFAGNYFLIDYAFPTAFHFNDAIQNPTIWSYIYYSVVTFTTLGFGDIIPTLEWVQRWVMAEVILGYVMLGGLISIFANKLARRS